MTFSGVIETEYWAKLGQVKKYYVKVNADIWNHAEFECYQNWIMCWDVSCVRKAAYMLTWFNSRS